MILLFSFYLDAVLYCRRNRLPLDKIVRQDWQTWGVKT